MSRLTNKVAIITGAANGIGRAAAALFAAEGANVLLVDIAEDALRAAVAEIGVNRASYMLADVSQPEQVEAFVQSAVERYGGLDVLVNNAGIEGIVKPFAEYPVEVFERVLAVNVRGPWLGIRYAVPQMRRRGGGSIIITSSIAGIQGSPGLSPYSTSKHAVIGMMRTAALEFAAEQIRVNTVNPAPVDTRMIHSLEVMRGLDADGARRNIESRIPMRRYGEPEEVARLMLFLASDESRFCTGGVYMVDGGVSAL